MPGTPLFMQHSQTTSVPNPLDSDLERATLTDLPPEELGRLMRQAWTGFYLRPRPLARLTIDAVRSGSVNEGLRMAAAWARWAVA